MTQNDLDFLKKYLDNKVNFGLISEIDAQDICGMMTLHCLEEPITEEELDRLAEEEYPLEDGIFTTSNDFMRIAFKKGYRKAKWL